MLSKTDSTLLKGIAILFVFTHNFLHWIAPMLGENEFFYREAPANNFINGLLKDPLNTPRYISIYIAPFIALHLFIFLSGYGLTSAYINKKINFKSFIVKRLSKLYPVFTIALIGLFVYKYVIFRAEFTQITAIDFFLRYTLLANFIPGKLFVLNGPFWFYSLIVQLYFCFPVLIYLLKKRTRNVIVVALLALVLIFCLNDYFSYMNFSLYSIFIGHLPIFIFGMLYSQYAEVINKQFRWLVPLALLLFVLGLYNMYFWYLSYTTFIILVLALFNFLKKYKAPKYINQFLLFSGGLSYYIFAVHGFLRTPWVRLANKADNDIFHYLYLLVFTIIIYLVAMMTREIERYYFRLLAKYKRSKNKD
ncbi:acyltransferase family protein [Lacinutrix jangbogonensis]|uniref:acyltransferase family protein n=1 Tax=Lacinutrix jangbogonensis TaxID=1469557 RepID=UPI00053D37DF|nr:acyltransferase family protein [Lacinutrix jangbogonensis]